MDKFSVISFCKSHKNWLALVLFFLLWLFILGFSGTITSGFHFTDDHEIVRIKNDLKTQSTLTVAMKWMKNDQLSTHRFRPFYFFHRVLETKVFGTNFTAWSIYTAILAVTTSFFLFCFLYLLKFSFWESILFPLVSLIGVQATIWWRLGPQESLGMFLLSASLFLLGLHITAQKNSKFFKILFVIFAILAALSKESFLLLLLALILLLPYLSHEKNGLRWKESIKKNAASIVLLAAVFVVCILYIKFFIGIGGPGYAGVDSFNLKTYFETFWDVSKNAWLSYFILAQILLLVILVFLKKNFKEDVLKIIKKFAFPAIIFLAIVVPQVVLYARSGFLKRYLVPVLLVYALAFVYSLRRIRKISKIIWAGIIILALFFVWGDVKNSFSDAKDFAQDGKSINSLFNVVQSKTSLDANILIVGDPVANVEWIGSIRSYLSLEMNRKNLFIYALSKKSSPTVGFDGGYGQNKYENVADKTIFDAIILFPKMERIFLENYPDSALLKGGDIKRQEFGDYTIYYKVK